MPFEMDDYSIPSSLRHRDAPPGTAQSEQSSRPLPFSRSHEYLYRNVGDDISPQSASPEVISNLITSLSAISTPVENHFNNLPDVDDNPSQISYNPQPILRAGNSPRKDLSRSPSRHGGFGKDYGAYNNVPEEEEDSHLGIDDAAMAPVVHFVKPSVSNSSLSHGANSPSRLSFRRSQQSLLPDDAVSTGIPSTEHNLLASSASIASSIRSGRSRNVRKTPSKDAVLDSQSPGSLRSGKSSEGLGLNIFGRSAKMLRPALSNRSLTDGIIQAYGTKADSLNNGNGGFVKERSNSTLVPVSPHDSISSVSVTTGAIVPSRRSSLRHSVSGSPGIKQQIRPTKKRHSSGSRDLSHLNIDPDLIEEDHQTVRRIRELQEAKEKRERDIRRDMRRGETSKSRSSMPGPQPPQRSTSNQSSPLSNSGVGLQVADQDPQVENGSDFDLTATSTTRANQSKYPLAVSAGNARAVPTAPPASQGGDLKEIIQSKRNSRPTSPLRHHRTFSKEKTRSRRNSVGFDRPSSANSIEEAVDTYLKSPRLTQRVRHPQTGRVIAFSEVGDPEGFAVFCCVGMGLTRYLTAFYDELARTQRLRLITPDRPGIGESEACTDGSGTPLNWADDVTIICNQLGITKFSLLAHSAGAVYALATALRLPQQVRGRLHLMAPWIPPSQMTSIGKSQKELVPAANVPYSQKLLRILPASFLKAANSSFLNARSASLNKSPRSKPSKHRSIGPEALESPFRNTTTVTSGKEKTPSPTPGATGGASIENHEATSNGTFMHGIGAATGRPSGQNAAALNAALRQSSYDERLTQCIWDLATLNANPAVDLLTCLERRQTIGFRYFDITRSVVIHHGSKDTRVPVDNVRWLGKMMRRCEVRILEGEGHGLMANASVMGAVLGEIAKEWEDWRNVTQAKGERESKRREKGEERY
jgi:pimeloyl-ACP methyl ester carboxylesterase